MFCCTLMLHCMSFCHRTWYTYILSVFVPQLVCECGVVLGFAQVISPFKLLLQFKIQSSYSRGKSIKQALQIQTLTLFPILYYSTICSQTGTLSAAHTIFKIPSYIFLRNTNQNKVGQTDHAVTQKLTQPFLLLSSCFLSIF